MKWKDGCEVICVDLEKFDLYLYFLIIFLKFVFIFLMLGYEDRRLSLFRGI